MSAALRKMGIYLGLVEEDDRALDDPQYAERGRDEQREPYVEERPAREPRATEATRTYSSYEAPTSFEPAGRRVPTAAGVDPARRPRPERAARVWTPEPVTPATRSTPVERPMTADEPNYRITTLHPKTYNEARTIGEQFRGGVPVIMNLTEMDDADAKRLVDFAAGLSFGLRGSIERVTNKVFLLSPQNVSVTAEDKARIAGGGFFNQS